MTSAACPDTVPSPRKPAPQNHAPLWRQYHSSGRGSPAEDELVRLHLPLVKQVVSRIALHLPSHADPDDLFSAGLVGLLDALRRYDSSLHASFQSYARVRIRGAIVDELRRLDWVPRSVHERARKVELVIHTLEQAAGAPPAEEDVAEALGVSLSRYRQILDEIRPATYICLDSIHTLKSGDSDRLDETLADLSQPDPSMLAGRHELIQLIAQTIESLPDVQKKVLALYYFEDLRLREIAEAFDLTESRICQIHAQAISAIKASLRLQGIPSVTAS